MWRTGVIAVCVVGMLQAENVGIVAHRGASAYAPENTLEAFALAWEQGADAIEGDFRLTADGEVVCVHDPSTKKVSGVDLAVAKSTAAELRELDVSRRFGRGFVDVRMPLLSEVLATVPDGKAIYIELKLGPEIVVPALEIVREHGREAVDVFFIAFDPEVIAAIEREDSAWRTGLLIDFKRSGFRLKPTYEEVFRMAGACGADELSVKAHPLLSPRFGQMAAERGYRFHVWTVDSPDWGREMVRRGAESVTTNVPDVMRAALQGEDGQ